MKKILIAIVLGISASSFAQNVDFKAANFKADKEGYKKIEAVLEKGEEFYKLGIEAVFTVQDIGLNFKKALEQFEIAQKYNPNSGLLNYKIGVCHANSSDPFKSISYFKTAQKLNPTCDPFLNYYLGYAYQLEGKYDDAARSYATFEAEYKK